MIVRITWKPIVFTFSLSNKQGQSDADKLAPYLARLEPLDMKAFNFYLPAETTHVVSSKRNIAKGLQALINGKYIVTDPFIDAVVTASTSGGSADHQDVPSQSPLEQDFDANWPDAMNYLPGPGKEPKPRPPELFAPNPNRINIFEHFTFIFADDAQYEQLQAPITNGDAKCVKYDMKLGQTTVDEFVRFVRGFADKKGSDQFTNGGIGKGIVIVRFRGKEDTAQWALDFIRNMDRQLGQQSFEQNEFLDAILSNDASGLRRPLSEKDIQGIVPPASAAVSTNAPNKAPTPPRGSPPLAHEDVPKFTAPKHRVRRTITQSRFKGFDDFDASQLPKSRKKENSPFDEEEEEEEEQPAGKSQSQLPRTTDNESQSLFVSDSQPATQQGTSISASRKRRHPPSLPEEDNGADAANAMVENLLPAAAAMKKRRLEEERAGTSSFSGNIPTIPTIEPETGKSKKKPAKKGLDVRSETRSYAKDLDARDRRDSESQSYAQHQDGDEEVAKLRNLAIVEEMDVASRRHARAHDGDMEHTSERWEERWNGRKNFKKFRRRGEEPAANRPQRVIVGLQEAKRKDYGIGEAYWLEPASTSKKKGRSQGQSQSQSQSQRQRQSDPVVIEEDDITDTLPEEVAGQPREGPVADALAAREQALAAARKGKRPASGELVQQASPAKMQRQTRMQVRREEDSDDDDDEPKFRFRRKRNV